MAAILIPSLFLQIFAIFLTKAKFENIRLQFLRTVLIFASFIWFVTELLSQFSAINKTSVLVFWTFANCLTGIYLFNLVSKLKIGFLHQIKLGLKTKSDWFSQNSYNILWFIIGAIFILVFATAMIFPPNTVDVLTYHLPRVAHWIQAGNVDFYPTNIERQLFNNPFAEYTILHLQILFGGDYCANLVQYFSFVSLGIVTSLIAEKFGLDKFYQLITVLIVSTIPIAILQASSAKNDLVVSLFICCFLYLYFQAVENNKLSDFVFAGLALGLALLTKGNAYLYCFPIGLFIFLNGFRRIKPTEFLIKTGFVVCLAVLINANHFYRNVKSYGNPIQGEIRLQNEKITLPIIYANLVRNYAVHLGIDYQPILETTENTVKKLLGDELNNPQSTVSTQYFYVAQSFTEDDAGNPFHLLISTFSLIYVLFYWKKTDNFVILSALSIIFGFVLFCTFLKWNVWVSRVHLPLFLLCSPLIAYFLSKFNQNKAIVISFGFLVSGFITILLGSPRNLLSLPKHEVFPDSRTMAYFTVKPEFGKAYFEATNFLKQQNPDEIGLDLSADYDTYIYGDWEYPFWILLKDDFSKKPILRHIGVKNKSAKVNTHNILPEWVISTNNVNKIENVEYEEVWKKSAVRILRKK